MLEIGTKNINSVLNSGRQYKLMMNVSFTFRVCMDSLNSLVFVSEFIFVMFARVTKMETPNCDPNQSKTRNWLTVHYHGRVKLRRQS